MRRGHPVKMRQASVFVAVFACLSASGVSGCAPPRGTIGAVLGQRGDGRLFVREAPPGLAAQKSGLSPGDEILLIDGKDVRGMNDVELDRALAGQVGTPVKLTVIRGEAVLRVTLVRTQAKRHPAAR